MNILSLFDGMSCGQQALTNLGFKDYTYFRSEIDKYAIQVTQENFPNTIQIGDVTKIGGKNTPWVPFDLLLGGSPCQGFSFAGDQLAFDDPRSALFFEYVRILKEVKPKYFLLENVKMKKEYQDVISEHLFGIQPIEINSSLLTAQNRKRLYWVGELQEDGNYERVEIEQPQDRGILLKDILEDEVEEKYYLNETQINKIINSNFMQEKLRIQKGDKCGTLLARDYKDPKCIINRPHGYFKGSIHTEKCPIIRSQVEGNILVIPEATKKGYIEVSPGDCFDFQYPNSNSKRGRLMREKANCLTVCNREFMNYDGSRIRKLTPIECERLQGVKDNYSSCVSNSQRYKMLGNGWTVPVIEYILSHLNLN